MKKYLIVIERADGNYSAYSPDLPGCVATGRTRASVMKNMREAMAWHIEGMREDAAKIPVPTTTAEYIAVE